MSKWLERMQQKPKSAREQYAFFGAVGFTLVIALVWVVSLPAKLSSIESRHTSESEYETSGAFSDVWSDAKANIANIFSSARLQGLSSSTEPEFEDTQGSTTDEVVSDERTVSENLEIMKLDEETISQIQSQQPEVELPPPRTVLISTTSNEVEATTSQSE